MIDPVLNQLLAAFRHVKTIRDMKFFCEVLFSPKELAQIPKRLEVLKRVANGEAYKKISEELKVSICTIARASNLYKAIQKENLRWWIEFKQRKGIPTEEFKDFWAELGVFTSYRERKKWEKRKLGWR